MLGYDTKNMLRRDPWLADLYQQYDACRNQQIEVFRKPSKTKKDKEEIVVVQWPTGYAQLPEVGGMDNQPWRTMRIFGGFLRGERKAVGTMMSR